MPAKTVPRDVNDVDALTTAIVAIEKKGGQVVQVLDVGLSWVIIHTATTSRAKAETR